MSWVLPDIVGTEPLVVFCGMAGTGGSRTRDHFYEGVGNSFWESLHLSGLDGGRHARGEPALTAVDDARLPDLGLGLTDLVRHRAARPSEPDTFELDELSAKVRRWQPEWLALTSKTVAAVVARESGARRPSYGVTDLEVGGAPVFVLPGPSGANRRHDYDGRPNRLSWWRDLAALVGR